MALLMIQVAAASTSGVNVARGKPTQQSSTLQGGTAGKVVDGNHDGNWAGGSINHTDNHSPWWEVDLGGVYDIEVIRIYNRTDHPNNQARLKGFKILVDGREFGGASQSLETEAVKEFTSSTNTRGRKVRIFQPRNDATSFLHMAEVYGTLAAGATPATSGFSRFLICEGVIDTTTDRCWERTPSGNTFNWQGAKDFCAAKGGGYRLATIDEYKTLPSLKAVDLNAPNGPFIVQLAFYWSATTDAGNPSFAWLVFFNSGGVGLSVKGNSHHAWCVRGG